MKQSALHLKRRLPRWGTANYYLDRFARSPYPWDPRFKGTAWDVQSRSKIDSREARNRRSEGRKWSSDRPGTAGSSQKHSRSHQNRAKSVPRAFQERPRASQELPRDRQEEPKGRPRGSKSRQGDPRSSKKGLQESQHREEIDENSLPERIAR